MAHPQQPSTSVSATPGTAPSSQPPADAGRAARIGLWVLGLGFGGFLLWAGLAPLDEGVPTHGMVAIDTKRKAVQHLSGGIVKQVLVREGDLVQQGQPLIELDQAVARANYEAVRQRYLGLRAMQVQPPGRQAGQPGGQPKYGPARPAAQARRTGGGRQPCCRHVHSSFSDAARRLVSGWSR